MNPPPRCPSEFGNNAARLVRCYFLNMEKEMQMNWDRVEGNWKQFKGKVKQQWGKLTDDELDVISGKRDELAGRIQEAYGVSKDEAEKQIAAWEERQDPTYHS
jgi:uncharacterized protein YjbJ (UPF0337 family)